MTTVESKADHEILRFFGEGAYEDWRLFEAHFELAAGSSVLVLLLPGAAGALICEQALAECLAKNNRQLERIRFSASSEIIDLGERLLALNLDGIGGIWISLLSPEKTDDDWQAACDKMFGLMNLHRNRLLKALPVPLVFVGEPWLQQVFREAAPDFWSVRSAVVRLRPGGESVEHRLEGISMESQTGIIGVEATSDPDYTLQQAHRLSNRQDLSLQRAELLARAASGFRENSRLELAESCFREALETIENFSDAKQYPLADFMRGLVLNGLAIVLNQLGHFDESLAKAQEAVRKYEQLTLKEPKVFLPEVAKSLNNLSVILSSLGRYKDAFEKGQMAVGIYEQLAKTAPGAFLPELAMSLNNLSIRLGTLDREEESLAKAQEAGRIREELARAQPDKFLPDLGSSLNNIANALGALGRDEEALAKAQEASRVYEQLAKTRRDTYLPDVAMSFHNLAGRLDTLGRHEEALVKAHEAARIYEQLAKIRPEAYEPDWARSVGGKRDCLKATKNDHEAAAASLQALQILEPHFLQRPAAHTRLMIWLINNYLADMKAIQEEPNMNLLGPIQELLEKFIPSQSKL